MLRPAIRSFRALLTLLLALTAAALPATAQLTHIEDFSTNVYEDVVQTTANWKTSAEALELFPFGMTLLDAVDTPESCVDVTVAGDLAFVADFPGILIYDISDPENLSLIGSFGSGSGLATYAAGDLLYVANGGFGLLVLDVSDPTNPTSIGAANLTGSSNDVIVQGDLAFVADDTAGLRIYDVSDPTTPTEIGLYDTPNNARGIDVQGDICYVADRGNSGFLAIDVSDPTAPALLGSNLLPGDTWNVQAQGDVVYASVTGFGVYALDVSDPATPTVIGSIDPGVARQVDIQGDYCYVAGNAELHVIDITDPTNMQLIETVPSPGITSSVATAGEHAFFAAGADAGLVSARISHPMTDPLETASLAQIGTSLTVTIDGNLAYYGEFEEGMHVVDISSPGVPVLLDTYLTSDSVRQIDIQGDTAYLACASFGLRIVDVSDPTATVEIGFYDPTLPVRAVEVMGDHAYVAISDDGVAILDIEDPTLPSVLGTVALVDRVIDVAAAGDYLYVAAGELGVGVVDISDPTNPTVVTTVDTPHFAWKVTVAGDLLYVADYAGGLRVLDISDPSSPFEVGFWISPSNVTDVALSGNQAILASQFGALHVVDVSDPTDPIEVATVSSFATVNGVDVAGNYAFVVGFNGLYVVQIYQRVLDESNNMGVSLPIDGDTETIVRARLSTTQLTHVSWELSADDGANWQSIVPGGPWLQFAFPGADLRWRSTHRVPSSLVNPTVTDLQLDWRVEHSPITSVDDVPDDQGGEVRVNFVSSAYDFNGVLSHVTTGYQVYQRVDPAQAGLVLSEGVSAQPNELGGPPMLRLGDRSFVDPSSGKAANTFPPGLWEAVGWVAATQSDEYTIRVSTVADQGAGGTGLSTYVISTHTTDPFTWFVSDPASGYSVDNIAPGVPQGFAVGYYTGSGNALSWDPASEPDFQYYNVYRSSTPDFIPTPAELVASVADPAWSDPSENGDAVYYKITALDHAGNESDPAAPSSVTGVDEPSLPSRFALGANVPNPFNPSTTIEFSLPQAAGRVSLRVYDAAGRHVRTLLSGEAKAGRQTVKWDGCTDAGRAVASGVYYYRLSAEGFEETRKMLLLK